MDSHTMGEPTRIILSGFPTIYGNTMMEKKQYLSRNLDHLRRALILEPRGHADMFGAVVTEPTKPDKADLGVIFMDSGGYLNMCGHGSIGLASVAVDQKLVPVQEPYTRVVLEAPAGIIETQVKVVHGKAVEVTITNVPCFLYRQHVELTLERFGRVTMDISFGGSFFALVNADNLGIALTPDNVPVLVRTGMEILKKINRQENVQHPYLDIHSVDLVEFYGQADKPQASLKNVVVFGDAQVDRSPCGTGSSAKVATLYRKGKLRLGEDFVYESITGSLFHARVCRETTAGDFPAVVPQVTGSAYVTGIHEIILDPDDPLKYGFRLKV
ncbi:MAG: proline racemase family protein [Oscillospiraceae bacterium]